MNTVHLTFDQDWAPPWTTRLIIDELQKHQLTGTFFVTHDCETLPELRGAGVELGWHPNFLPGSSHGATTAEVLATMKGLVPDATGARAHCLIRGTPYLMAYRDAGIRYDAADIHDGVPNLAPFDSWTGVRRIPIWFEDDVHLARKLPCTFKGLSITAPGLKVMTFHPVLLGLNASGLECYDNLKRALSQSGTPLTDATEADFAPHRDSGGVLDLFRSVCAWLAQNRDQSGGPLNTLTTG